ncbi:MAG: hypothetical protein ACOYXY_01765 [Thermodesulfobacteriota bacterium]
MARPRHNPGKDLIMKTRTVASWIAFVGGCIVIFQGIRHFPLAYQMAEDKEFAGLSTNASDMLILLWLCIGILLLNFGILSLYFSRRLRAGDQAARVFFLCGGITYFVRTLLELKYPVLIPTANHFVLVSVFLVCLLFLIPVLLTRSHEAVSS